MPWYEAVKMLKLMNNRLKPFASDLIMSFKRTPSSRTRSRTESLLSALALIPREISASSWGSVADGGLRTFPSSCTVMIDCFAFGAILPVVCARGFEEVRVRKRAKMLDDYEK